MKKPGFLVLAFCFAATLSAQVKVTSAQADPARPVASAQQEKEKLSLAQYEYATATFFVQKDGSYALMKADDDRSRDAAITGIKEKIGAAENEQEREELMKQYERISSGQYSAEDKLADMGRAGYELVSVVSVPAEGGNQLKLFFKRFKTTHSGR